MSYRPLPQINDDLEQLQARLQGTRQRAARERLRMLVLIKTQACRSRTDVAQQLGRHRNTIARWISAYEQGGLKALLHQKPMGKPPGQRTLSAAQLAALEQRLQRAQGLASYVELQQWLADEYDLEIPYKTLHRIVRYELKAKLKRPRPEHPKKN